MFSPFLFRAALGVVVGASALAVIIMLTTRPPEYGGRVVDQLLDQPVGGAIVTMGETVVSTASDGTFHVTGRGDRIRARAPGYLRGGVPVSAVPEPQVRIALTPFQPKALYLSASGIASRVLRGRALRLIEETELNALVIDVKGDWGRIPYESGVPLAAEIGANKRTVSDMPDLIGTLRQQGIYIHRPDRGVQGRAAGNAAAGSRGAVVDGCHLERSRTSALDGSVSSGSGDYNVDLAVEAAELGFDEIQFDYVRLPDATGLSFSQKSTQSSRIAAISGFLEDARQHLAPHNVFLSADVFGYVCWNLDDLMIGQKLEDLMPMLDYVAPMLYPSSFQFGIPGCHNPVAHPHEIVYRSLERAVQRTGVSPRRFRPWLQAFKDYAFDRRSFGGNEIRAQISAAEEVGSNGWMLWNPRNVYSNDGLLSEEK